MLPVFNPWLFAFITLVYGSSHQYSFSQSFLFLSFFFFFFFFNLNDQSFGLLSLM